MKVFEKKEESDRLSVDVCDEVSEISTSLQSKYLDMEIWLALTYTEWDSLVAAVTKARENSK